jgi:hypothetical protein
MLQERGMLQEASLTLTLVERERERERERESVREKCFKKPLSH